MSEISRSLEIVELEKNSPNKPDACAVEKIITNNFFQKVAVKCGCGQHHPILGEDVKWIKWIEPLSKGTLFNLENGHESYARIMAQSE